jgi:uncharacterized membrane protein
MTFTINFLALFLLMLVAGVFWGPWFALTRSLRVFSAEEFIKITRTLSTNIGPGMRFLLPGTIVVTGVAAALFPDKQSMAFYLAIASPVLLAVSLIVTVAVEVPIVKTVEQWTAATLPADWAAKRDRWLKFHIIRVVVSFGSFACFAAAMLSMK